TVASRYDGKLVGTRDFLEAIATVTRSAEDRRRVDDQLRDRLGQAERMFDVLVDLLSAGDDDGAVVASAALRHLLKALVEAPEACEGPEAAARIARLQAVAGPVLARAPHVLRGADSGFRVLARKTLSAPRSTCGERARTGPANA